MGKSTLLNGLIGQKLAAVSAKPQTTRLIIRGILNDRRGQIVFLDTPGIHSPKDALGERMVSAVRKTNTEADIIYWMVPPVMPQDEDVELLKHLKTFSKPIFLLINKADAVPKPSLLPVIDAYRKLHPFDALFPISSLSGDNLNELLKKTFERLPEGPNLFPADLVSDQTERFIAAEMIREKIFQLTGEEIPYSTAVVINEFKERSSELVAIDATIFTEKPSQKKILIGESGNMVKKIGTEARKEIERFLGKKVFLKLWVKEREHWKEDETFLRELEQEGGQG